LDSELPTTRSTLFFDTPEVLYAYSPRLHPSALIGRQDSLFGVAQGPVSSDLNGASVIVDISDRLVDETSPVVPIKLLVIAAIATALAQKPRQLSPRATERHCANCPIYRATAKSLIRHRQDKWLRYRTDFPRLPEKA